jgi:hypothetical protein
LFRKLTFPNNSIPDLPGLEGRRFIYINRHRKAFRVNIIIQYHSLSLPNAPDDPEEPEEDAALDDDPPGPPKLKEPDSFDEKDDELD